MKSAINNLVIQSVRAPTELVSYMGMPSGTPCNIDPILAMKGQATIGLGSSYGKDRAVEATMAALKSNSFNLIDLNKAQGVLVNITTGEDYTISEYVKVGNVINNFIDQELTEMVVFNAIKTKIKKRMDVTIIATGINGIAL